MKTYTPSTATMDSEDPPDVEPDAAWQGVSAAFAALGRTFLCLDGDFRIVHASPAIDESLGQGASQRVVGQHVSELLGPELFGPAGTLTLALLSATGGVESAPAARRRCSASSS